MTLKIQSIIFMVGTSLLMAFGSIHGECFEQNAQFKIKGTFVPQINTSPGKEGTREKVQKYLERSSKSLETRGIPKNIKVKTREVERIVLKNSAKDKNSLPFSGGVLREVLRPIPYKGFTVGLIEAV